MGQKPEATFSLIRVLGVIFAILFALSLTAIFVPSYLAASKQGRLTTCKVNLKDLAQAIQEYTNEHENRYPESLSALIPQYLDAVPVCPGAKRDTYSRDYRALVPEREFGENEHGQKVLARPGYFLGCGGDSHQDVRVQPGYPQYDDYHGLVEAPEQRRFR